MTGTAALKLEGIRIPTEREEREKRQKASLRLELAWIDLQLWIAAVLSLAAVLPTILFCGDSSRWPAAAFGLEAAFCLLLVGVRARWRRRVRREWESAPQPGGHGE